MMDRHTTCALTQGYASLADSGPLLNILRRAGRTMRRAKPATMETHIHSVVHFSNEVDEMTVQRMINEMGDRPYHDSAVAFEFSQLHVADLDGTLFQVNLQVDDPEMGGRIEGMIDETNIYIRRWCQRNLEQLEDISTHNIHARPDPVDPSDCDHPEESVGMIDAPPAWDDDKVPLCDRCGDVL
jgi:hypothetical protein